MYAVKDNRTSLLDRMIDLGSDVGARNNASIFILGSYTAPISWLGLLRKFHSDNAHSCANIKRIDNLKKLFMAKIYDNSLELPKDWCFPISQYYMQEVGKRFTLIRETF